MDQNEVNPIGYSVTTNVKDGRGNNQSQVAGVMNKQSLQTIRCPTCAGLAQEVEWGNL